MKINETYHGFQLIDTHDVKEIKSKAHVFMHEKTKAKLLFLENDDEDKVFSVAFRTPPKDSTGVPHIIEHCVLSGSRKYKTKEPFMDMVKGSLKTFINAMTFSDKTIYPVASKNSKDFRNLMDVYLDAVFFPMIHDEKEIFMQEGWHYNIFEKEAPVQLNGVVYNEMRGAYSQPTTQLREVINRSLFPDTTYQYSSGGNPDVIPELTYEDFKKFHDDYYHPSNAYFYLYGNGDILEYLEHIEGDYLSHFEEKTIDSSIALQAPFNEPVSLVQSYGVSSEESLDNKTFLSMNFVIGEGTDKEAHMVGEILKEVLVGAAAGPIKKALLKAGVGQDIMCSFGGGKQLTFNIIAKNADENQKDEFESIIFTTLKDLIRDGIDKDLLRSAVNIAEYDMREATGFATKGIIYHMLSMNSWLYDGQATELLHYDDQLKAMREYIETDFYERYVDKKLLENTHRSLVVLKPEKGVNEKKAELLEEKLKAYKASLSDSDLDKLIQENESLKKKQLSPDSKDALDTIPKLSVEDVNKAVEEIPSEVIEKEGVEIIKHDIFSNDIAYIEWIFDTRKVNQDDLQYIALLSDLLGKLSTKNYNYGDLSSTIYKETGGVSFATRTYVNGKKQEYYPKFVLSGKAISSKIEPLVALSKEVITSTLFDDEKRLKEVLLQSKSRLEMAINSRGDNYASTRVASYFAESSQYSELMRGFEYYWFLCDVIDNLDDIKINKLKEIYELIFNKQNLKISFTGDSNSYSVFERHFTDIVKVLNQEAFTPQIYKFDLSKKNEGITSSSNVQYCAQGYNFRKLGYEYSGKMQVLRALLNSEYLHDRIRAKGGAYGCGISFSDSGNIVATSFRDPKLSETLQVFNELYDFTNELDLTDDEITKFIIGAISRSDAAMTAKGKGMFATANHISGITLEMLQEDRDAVLSTKSSDFKAIAQILKDIMNMQHICVYGNDVKIKESKETFDTIRAFNQ
jgi:Zn-dependent M16 (insulinase) family peptidase